MKHLIKMSAQSPKSLITPNERIVERLKLDKEFRAEVKDVRKKLAKYSIKDKATKDKVIAYVVKNGFINPPCQLKRDENGKVLLSKLSKDKPKPRNLKMKYLDHWRYRNVYMETPAVFLYGDLPSLENDPKKKQLVDDFCRITAGITERTRLKHKLHHWWRNTILQYLLTNSWDTFEQRTITKTQMDAFGTVRQWIEIHPNTTEDDIKKFLTAHKTQTNQSLPAQLFNDIESALIYLDDSTEGVWDIYGVQRAVAELTNKQIAQLPPHTAQALQRLKEFYVANQMGKYRAAQAVYFGTELDKRAKDSEVRSRNEMLYDLKYSHGYTWSQLLNTYKEMNQGQIVKLQTLRSWVRRYMKDIGKTPPGQHLTK